MSDAQMRGRLTLDLPRQSLTLLEEWAAARGVSATDLVESYLAQLCKQGNYDRARPNPEPRETFTRLADEWRRKTKYLGSLTDIIAHPSYQRIIGMGEVAIPLLLDQLQRNPGQWFWALKAITGEDPVPEEARGDLKAMTAAWLKWGERRGHRPAATEH